MPNINFMISLRTQCYRRQPRMSCRNNYLLQTIFVGVFVLVSLYLLYKGESVQHDDFLLVNHEDNDPPKANNYPVVNLKCLNDSAAITDTGLVHRKRNNYNHRIYLAVVCCGDRSEETLVMLKSAVLNTQRKLHFHIFAEEELKPGLAKSLKSWPTDFQAKIEFTLHSIQFPNNENPEEWKSLFRTCATQRLFIPDVLTDVDSLLYVDTDTLFIRPPESLWSFFNEFNATHLAALAPEDEIAEVGWYDRFARHPYYGLAGLNSGVLLMNLTRMRSFGWTEKIVPLYHEYKQKIPWGDQDLLNILFYYHPDRVFIFPCEWNFRPNHCIWFKSCFRTNIQGVSIIHGSHKVFHSDKNWPFRIVYEAFLKYKLGLTPETHLVQNLQRKLSKLKSSDLFCGKTLLQPVITTLNSVQR
ncbi:glucoside xylosyltransferase 2-like [Anneissia japonica]|uniref:glucoside xylosyltransferase 2-like n=1 Tax=Anneissia japonica TaxID=1529436 RepID=UPI0014258299|nr:glucoside xylosyltransferase 2-like [Anneissia japonica]